MLISVRVISVVGFAAWFSAFFVIVFPAAGLHFAVMELWQYPLIYLPEIFVHSRQVDRVTILGLAIGFIFCGSLCDWVGRYRTMLICLVVSPFLTTICGYFADALLFLILHFLVGVFVSGTLVSSTALVFESVPSSQRWKVFNFVIIGGVIGAILPFLFESIGWRSLYQIQLLPVFFVPILGHWSDEPLVWKFAVRDKQVDITANSLSAQKQLLPDNAANATNSAENKKAKTLTGKKYFQQLFASAINELSNTYFVSLGEMLLNRRHLLVPALLLTVFGVCGLVLALMSFGEGVRRGVYQSYDLDVRTAMRVQSGEVDLSDVDAVLVAYIIEKPLILDLINMEESRIDLMPQVLRGYGYSRDDVPGCVADGLFELVRRLRGERITKELVMDRAVMRWNSRFGNGRAEIDIPESVRNRIRLKAGYFLNVGEQTLAEVLMQNRQTSGDNKSRNLASERRKTNTDKWQEWCDEFLLMWDNLLFVTEDRYGEGERSVSWLKLFCLAGCLFGGLIIFLAVVFNVVGRGWTQRRVFCAMFVVLALLSVMAVMLSRVGLSFGVLGVYAFVCGVCVMPLVTCYLVTIPAMFPAVQRGAAIGFCFGLPLLVVFLLVCVIPVSYIYYLIPICFVSGVFAIGIPARKK
ncbi:MAG: MFS transporter [Planctomycetaceae bacterium]|jgi:MFS family permease|nr:MFS transporter [Planctomycetaceae bacterium]